MPNLTQSLRSYDLGHLRIIAEHWGVDFEAPDAQSAIGHLIPRLLDDELAEEIVDGLPQKGRDALKDLLQNSGRLSWPLFARRYGEIREMGPGRRDRERPDRGPASVVETLWYSALVARAFFDTTDGPQEFAYIPEDLIPFIYISQGQHASSGSHAVDDPLGRPASPEERTQVILASDHLVDDATTFLAALRIGFPTRFQEGSPTEGLLHSLLTAAGLLNSDGTPIPDPTRAFLEASRGEALAQLARAWLGSSSIDEIRLLPGLRMEGEWENDPLRTRQTILDFLSGVPKGAWWSLSAFVAAIKEHHPDFQRPAGNYDSWYLRDKDTSEYLRGFEHWDDVDGALIEFIITGPLHWLGVFDLAAPEEDESTTAFRYTRWAANLLKGIAPEGLSAEEARIHIRSDGRVNVPRLTPRSVRYQVARFCTWETEKSDEYRYRLTPSALSNAAQQNLRLNHLLALLQCYADGIPPSITKALTRWDDEGTVARIEHLSVLRLSSPEVLHSLRRSRAARFLGDPLGPTTIVVSLGAEVRVLAVLAEMGYLGEVVE